MYGTLLPDGGAWAILEPWTVGTAEADAVPGTLYDTGRGYPAATFDPAASGLVRGVVVALDASRSDAALDQLDRYEGHEYARVQVRAVSGALVVTYAWTGPLDRCAIVPGGAWPVPPEKYADRP